jgi:hypothetical protein
MQNNIDIKRLAHRELAFLLIENKYRIVIAKK